jgi:membrane protein DedA with SNARE-associated domain
MDIITWGIQFVKDFIGGIGVIGIFFLMTLESMCLPIPSELILPFGGWLASDGKMDVFMVGLAGSLGCLAGSIIAYAIGFYGGRQFIIRYGRYVFLKEKSIESAECWFKKYGNIAIFGSRLLPVVRTFISLPAGVAKMDFTRFTILSFIGSVPWCFAFAYAGYYLGQNWESLGGIYNIFTIIVVIAIIVLFVWFFFLRRRKKCEVEGRNSE